MADANSIKGLRPIGISDDKAWKSVAVAEEVLPLTGGLCTKAHSTSCVVVTYKEGGKVATDKFIELNKKNDFLSKAITGNPYNGQWRDVTVIDEIRERMMISNDTFGLDETAFADALTDNVEDPDPMNGLEALLATDMDATGTKIKRKQQKK